MMTTSEPSTTFQFPYPELTPIVGKPDYLGIAKIKKELTSNAMSVYSARGNGQLGHAVIVLGVHEYNNVSAVAWADPVNPGPGPVIPAGATNAQINAIRDGFTRDQYEWRTFDAVGKKLKQQLLTAVPHEYLSSLEHQLCGFANVTVHQLLTHLEDTYVDIDTDALNKNLESLKEPWEPAETLEPLWERGIKAQQLATAGGEPITDAALMREFYAILKASGVFPLDIRDWDKLPAANKTLANFKTHFTAANKDRVKNTTAGQLGQNAGSAFGAIGTPTPPPPTTEPVILVSTGNAVWKSMYYCWSHGLGTNKDHTSKTCTKKAQGHKEDATVDNMMGGNNTIRRLSGERPVFKPKQRSRNPQSPTPEANGAQGNGTPSQAPPATGTAPAPAPAADSAPPRA